MGDSNNENTGQYNKIAELHSSASRILGETLDIERDVFETLGNLKYTESSKDNIIKISLHIWKLMRRPYEEFTHDNDVYLLGEFRKTHYWKSVTSTYII